MAQRELIVSKQLEEHFITEILGKVYTLRFVSDLDLFLEYKTTGEVSKIEVKLGIPPEIRWNIVDNRSCHITHNSDFKFHFYVYSSDGSSLLKHQTLIELNGFRNFLLFIFENLLSNIPAGILSNMGAGESCRCAGSIGKSRIKEHKKIYLQNFELMLIEIHNYISENFMDLVYNFNKNAKRITPTTLDINKIKDKTSFITKLYESYFGYKPSKKILIELSALNSINKLNEKLCNIEINQFLAENPKERINSMLSNIKVVTSKMEELEKKVRSLNENKTNYENNSIRNLDDENNTIRNYNDENNLYRNIDLIDYDIWSKLDYPNKCILVPGEYGMMNPNYFLGRPIESDEMRELYKDFCDLKEPLEDILEGSEKLQERIRILDFDDIELKHLDNFIKSQFNEVCFSISGVIGFMKSYESCTKTKGKYKELSKYEMLMQNLNDPQYFWTNPGRPDFERINIDEISISRNSLLNEININQNQASVGFNDVINNLPYKVKSEVQLDLITSTLEFASENENVEIEVVESINKLLENYNEDFLKLDSDKIKNSINALKSQYNK